MVTLASKITQHDIDQLKLIPKETRYHCVLTTMALMLVLRAQMPEQLFPEDL